MGVSEGGRRGGAGGQRLAGWWVVQIVLTGSLLARFRGVWALRMPEGVGGPLTRSVGMTRKFGALMLAALVAVPACRSERADEAAMDAAPTTETAPPVTTPAPMPPTPLMTVAMQPEGTSKVTGEVQVLPVDGDANAFRVSAHFMSVPEGEHAWHIHRGACGTKDAPVVVPFTPDKNQPGIASPVTAGADGNATAEASVPSTMLSVEQLKSGDFSLHIHEKGGSDHGPSIACANLK